MQSQTVTIVAQAEGEPISDMLRQAGWANYDDQDLQHQVAQLNGYDTIASFRFRIREGENYLVPAYAPVPLGEPDLPDPESPDGSTSKPEYQYTWVRGDTIWEVARNAAVVRMDAVELLEHNSMTVEEAGSIQPGTIIHLTAPRDLGDRRTITYDIDGYPKIMHVSHELGTQKIAFADARMLPVSRHYKHKANVEIVAKAHVPIGDGVYGFYMDAWALGTYKETGKVAHAIGFNHSHLTEGEYVEPTILEEPEVVLQRVDEIIEELEEEMKEERINYDVWKETYRDFPVIKHSLLKDTLLIHDLDARHPDRLRSKYDEIVTTGVFTGPDGNEYERPPRSSTSYHWYGIPPHMLEPEAEVYNTNLELYEKVAMRQPLTLAEKTFEVFARNVTELRRLKVGYDKFKHKK